MADSHYKERKSPRISANQLAAYLVAGASTRNRIIRDAKFQPTVVIIHYKEARAAIAKFLASPTRDWKIITQAKADLQKLIVAAPRTYAAIAKEIEGACKEIADRWDGIDPPPPPKKRKPKAP